MPQQQDEQDESSSEDDYLPEYVIPDSIYEQIKEQSKIKNEFDHNDMTTSIAQKKQLLYNNYVVQLFKAKKQLQFALFFFGFLSLCLLIILIIIIVKKKKKKKNNY
jgi:ATP-dependent Zn protease